MSEWWTYRLSDFLMFSPAIYWRLVERYNRQLWPVHLAALAAGLVLLWLAASRRANAARVVLAALAAAWLWVGWAFYWQRYAPINWPAQYLAVASWLQALLMLGFALLASRWKSFSTDGRARALGLAVAAVGIFLYPLAGLLAGRPWRQAEVFGLMPEPTALATLGLLLAMGLASRAWLAVIPSLLFAAGMMTLWMMSGMSQ